ncbi:MAG: metallophosphoesterase, partial [Betaproteobacteria bacterium]|nr:metallophosphoesterase [Betaproteobacteria bacterium]
RDFGLGRFSPRRGWPVPVLFVPGNHEYDGLDFDEAHVRLRETCERLGITWLEREVLTLQGVRFVGTTLWSDFDALGPLAGRTLPEAVPAHAAPAGYTQQLRARDKAFRAANHYLRKAGTTRHGEPWLAEAMRTQALLCQDWLRQMLAQPHDGPTVVLTHFAPSLRSADPRYGMTPGTAGFCNALDDLLAHAQLWLHGHLHCPSNYVHAGCQVRANPLGYAHKGEQACHVPQLTLAVPAPQVPPPV